MTLRDLFGERRKGKRNNDQPRGRVIYAVFKLSREPLIDPLSQFPMKQWRRWLSDPISFLGCTKPPLHHTVVIWRCICTLCKTDQRTLATQNQKDSFPPTNNAIAHDTFPKRRLTKYLNSSVFHLPFSSVPLSTPIFYYLSPILISRHGLSLF
jgi:hypothetical protein